MKARRPGRLIAGMGMGRVVGLLASLAVVGAVILTAASWSSGAVGYVEIRTVPVAPLTQAALYIDAERLGPIRQASAILRQPVGIRALAARGAAGRLVPLCRIDVRKDRITIVTVSVLDRPPRCQCRYTGDAQACVS